MRVQIEFECDNAAFEDFPKEVLSVLGQASRKVIRQAHRTKCACDAPESDDVLLDANGNTIGTVKLEG